MEMSTCENCHEKIAYELQVVHDVSLCPNCVEALKRGLLPVARLSQIRSDKQKQDSR
jgi:PHP family Zn ribbon phosphoesterase